MITPTTVRISVRGKPVDAKGLIVDDRTIVIRGRALRVARVFDDFLDSDGVDDPEAIIKILQDTRQADIFTFLSNFSIVIGEKEEDPAWKIRYHLEYEYDAVIRVISFDQWFKKGIKKQTRRRVKKARECGVRVNRVPLDDDLIQGIVGIYNETPIRQGKKYWHYGKKFDQIKQEISTYADRSTFIGAYWNDQLIGFSKLINCGKFGRANQLVSMVKHHDKPVTNALIAELVRTCECENIPYLKFGAWIEGSLGHFKKNNGFKKVTIPRYYKALTLDGKVALKVGMHKGIRELLPYSVRNYLRSLRQAWYRDTLLRRKASNV